MEKGVKNKIVCFGEILWDLLPQGKKLGGAPFNVAAHFALLGNESYILSSIGDDDLGSEICSHIQDIPVNLDLLQISQSWPTGTVDVTLDNSGKPTYVIAEQVAWDHIKINPEVIKSVSEANALIYGTLALRGFDNNATLDEVAQHAKLKVLDLNLRGSYYSKDQVLILISRCDVLKLNDEELVLISQYFQKSEEETIKEILNFYGPSLIVLTRGEDGASAYEKDKSYFSPGIKVEVVDTVGSGDAFLAGFLDSYLKGNSIETCLEYGCKMGAFVASYAGAIPIVINEKEILQIII